MRLYHLWLHPASRALRLQLHEKKIEHSLKLEKLWEQDQDFLSLNPRGTLPILVDKYHVICDLLPCFEYIEECYHDNDLRGETASERAETRRIIIWFTQKFEQEISHPIIEQKLFNAFLYNKTPDSRILSQATDHLYEHLEYFEWLLERQSFLANNSLSLADLTGSAYFSCLDYLNIVPWDKFIETKNWYARIKSRPAFQGLLQEYIPSFPPPSHYDNLDF